MPSLTWHYLCCLLSVDQRVVAFRAFAKVGSVVFILVQGSTRFIFGHPVSRWSKGFFCCFCTHWFPRAMGKPRSDGALRKRPASQVSSNDGPLVSTAAMAELKAMRNINDFRKRSRELGLVTGRVRMRPVSEKGRDNLGKASPRRFFMILFRDGAAHFLTASSRACGV